MTIIIWVTVIAAIITLAVGKHATDRWAAEDEIARQTSAYLNRWAARQLGRPQRYTHRIYPIRRFAAFTTCPGCGTVGCFPWELPPDPTDAQDESVEPLEYRAIQPISAYNDVRYLWGGEAFYTTRTHDEPPPDATTCDVIRTCSTCGARWGER